MTKRKYYACRWPYGRASNSAGEPLRDVYAFESKAERDQFTDRYFFRFPRDGGYREPLLRKNLTASERASVCVDRWQDARDLGLFRSSREAYLLDE